MSQPQYRITDRRSYTLHVAAPDGGPANLCPSDAAQAPNEVKLANARTTVCKKCSAAWEDLQAMLGEQAQAVQAQDAAEGAQLDQEEAPAPPAAPEPAVAAAPPAQQPAPAAPAAEQPAPAAAPAPQQPVVDAKKLERIKRQVRAALRMAERETTSPEELAAAMAKAAQLMAQYQLEEGQLGEDVPVALRPTVVMFAVTVADNDRIGARRRGIVETVATAMGGVTVWFSERTNGRASVAGFRVEVYISSAVAEMAQSMVALALVKGEAEMNRQGKAYRAQKGLTAQQRDTGYQLVRRSALSGFAHGVGVAMQAARVAAVQQALPELPELEKGVAMQAARVAAVRQTLPELPELPELEKTGARAQLVLKSEWDRAKDVRDAAYPRLRKGVGAKGPTDWDAYLAGYAEGERLTQGELGRGARPKAAGELAA